MNYLFAFRIIQATLFFLIVGVSLNFFFSKERSSIRELTKHSLDNKAEADIIVFPVKKAITLDPTTERDTNIVAVKDGIFVYVGKASNISETLAGKKYFLDKSFKDKVIFPGIVDSGSYLLLQSIVNTNVFRQVVLQDQMRSIKDIRQAKTIYFTPQLEGEDKQYKATILYSSKSLSFVRDKLNIESLDEFFGDEKVLIWDKILAKGYYNSSFKEFLGIEKEGNVISSDVEFIKLMSAFYDKENFKSQLVNSLNTLGSKGITTVVYSNFGTFDARQELSALTEAYEENNIPVRIILRIAGNFVNGSNLLKIEYLVNKTVSTKILYKKHIDIALGEKVVIGNKTTTLDTSEKIQKFLQQFWGNGYNIKVSIKNRESGDVLVNAISAMQSSDHKVESKFVIGDVKHLNHSLIRAVSSFNVSVFVGGAYFNSLLSSTTGEDKKLTTNLKVLDNFGVKYSINNNINPVYYNPFSFIKLILENNVSGDSETKTNKDALIRQNKHNAFSLITIVPAQILGIDINVGSIEEGKMADFIAINKDLSKLRFNAFSSINVDSTAFEGEVFNY